MSTSQRVAAWLLALAVCGCGPPPLAHVESSADAVARRLLDALARRDEGALRDLALDEREFRVHVWPSLPAALPERNLPFSYVWGDLRQKSETSLRGILAEHGGRRYDLVRVRFAGRTTDYAGFRVHRDTVIVVRLGGEEVELKLCGSLVEKDGGWKVFSYLVDS